VRLASCFLPDVESLTGTASGTVDITGSLESPQLEGRFRLTDADLKVWQLRDHLTPLEIDVVLHDSLASIVKAHAVASAEGYRGDIAATGDLVFKDLSTIAYDLRIKGRNVPARYEFADFVGRFDVDLTVTESNPPLLQGTAFVHEAYYRDPFEYADSLTRLANQVQIDTSAWNLYIDARIPKNAWTKNRDVNAEWSGDLRIIRQQGEWNYLGRLEPLRGSYYFFGKRFRNLRGEIIFDDIHQVDPRLNLEADVNLAMGVDTQSVSGTQGLSYRDVTVRVEGRLSEPKIVPPAWLGENNFYVALNPLGHPDAHGDRNWAESAALGAAGILAGELERLGTRTLGVETFELRPNEQGRYDLDDARLRIGTYLLPDVYVYGSSGVDVTKGTEVGFEYRLRNWLTVQGNRNFENLYKFDLRLKWEMEK
jgi:hypothetical protein